MKNFILIILNLLIFGFSIGFESSAKSSSVRETNRKFLEQHKQRLESEIVSLKKNTPAKPTPKEVGKFNVQIQNQKILQLKMASMEVVRTGLSQLGKISRFGELRDLNEVALALEGIDPLDVSAAEKKSKDLGYSHSKSFQGGGGRRLQMSIPSKRLDSACLDRLKEKYSNNILEVICGGSDISFACGEITALCRLGRRDDSKHSACRILIKNHCSQAEYTEYKITPQAEKAFAQAAYLGRCETCSESQLIEQLVNLLRTLDGDNFKDIDRRKLAEAALSEEIYKQEDYYEFERSRSAKIDPQISKFIRDIGIRKLQPNLKDEVDLSEQFYAPQFQGKTGACSAFSMAADLEVTGKTPKLSEGAVYTSIVREGSPQWSDAQWLSRSNPTDPKLAKDWVKFTGVYFEEWIRQKRGIVVPASRGTFEQEFLADFKDPKSSYQVEKSVSVGDPSAGLKLPVNLGTMKGILNAEVPPVAWISSDARSNFEDWIRIEGSGSSNHLFNIVGHGKGIDPSDGIKKDYFIVRDSLDSRGIHSKIPAENLLLHLLALEKITAVKKVEN